jgi:hypothetical protein
MGEFPSKEHCQNCYGTVEDDYVKFDALIGYLEIDAIIGYLEIDAITGTSFFV